MSIFKEQSYFDLVLDMGVDVSGASSLVIHVRKPSGTEVQLTGTLFETNKVKYAFTPGDLDEAGLWEFQAVAVIGGRTAYGQVAQQLVEERLTTL